MTRADRAKKRSPGRSQAAVSELTAARVYVRDLASTLDFRVLGPLEVTDGERRLALGGTQAAKRARASLLHAGETVSSDRLIDELWGEQPPADAQTALQQHVSRLRKALEPHAVLATRAPGYALEIAPEHLDLERFRALVETRPRRDARRRPGRGRRATLRDALALWRGPPLADLANEPFAADATRALDEERIAALETRIDADLACGRHGAARRRADVRSSATSRCASACVRSSCSRSIAPAASRRRSTPTRTRGRRSSPSSGSSPGLSSRSSSRRS